MKNKFIICLKKIIQISLAVYILICWLLFFLQEKIIFFPEKLDPSYTFNFEIDFSEINIPVDEDTSLHGLLFPVENSKWLIFYLHGNAGSLRSWWNVAKSYTDLQYDVFILDYRWYGKSSWNISSEEQLFTDAQISYDYIMQNYNYEEKNITILWYSLWSWIAAKLASTNNPKLLILQAPYYSMLDMMWHTYPFVPWFLLKYKLQTNNTIENISTPIVIFHGKDDRVIYHGSSLKLEQKLKKWDKLITLENQWHNGITYNQDYISEIKKLLNQ